MTYCVVYMIFGTATLVPQSLVESVQLITISKNWFHFCYSSNTQQQLVHLKMISECELRAYAKGGAYFSIGNNWIFCFSLNWHLFCLFFRILLSLHSFICICEKVQSTSVPLLVGHSRHYCIAHSHLHTERFREMSCQTTDAAATSSTTNVIVF